MDTREKLQNISNNYSARLSHAARRNLVSAGVESARSGVFGRFHFGGIRQMALAAGLVGLLVAPALFMRFGRPAEAPREPISNLSVTLGEDGNVVLAWTDGDAPRQVVRATSREQLKDLSRLPGESVQGERWVDVETDQSDIVYYIVN